MSESFLILHVPSSRRADHCLWWRPAAAGYTIDVLEAGEYSRVEAATIERMRPGVDRAVPSEVARRLAVAVVSSSHMGEMLAEVAHA